MLRVGYVPEHFSTPLHFAQVHCGLQVETVAFPSGTGHMITALRAGEIDVGIGLTEGWVAGLGKEEAGRGGYSIIGKYVETPLCWAISAGKDSPIAGIADLQGGKIGVSRIGSGSFVMGHVLADQQGWGDAAFRDTVVLNTFANLRAAVNDGRADFFMWEHFTSKKYYDSGEIKRVGEIYTPWSSWQIVASTAALDRPAELDDLLRKLDEGIAYFNEHPDEAVAYISTSLDYSEADARAWLATVRFPQTTRGVDAATIDKCIGILQKAGVLVAGQGPTTAQMVATV